MSSRANNDVRIPALASSGINLRELDAWNGVRVLAWDGDVLYAARGYELVRLQVAGRQTSEVREWKTVAAFQPAWWRTITSRSRLTFRFVRDGFHALTILNDGAMVAAVPGAIVSRTPSSDEFHPTHKILRGTRPLHIAAVPGGNIYWGEYFDNRDRCEVHIYASSDRGETWQVAHTFPARAIRHVHNVIYDRYADCLWILTGDEGRECKILRADCNLNSIEVVLEGNQQARAVAAIPTEDALYLSTDTPYEQNHVLRLDRAGQVETVADLPSCSIFGCQTANALFFSTMAEPSAVNTASEIHLFGAVDGAKWQVLRRWQKDGLPMHYFQYGNAILPDGENTTNCLAATSIAVTEGDLVTTLWEVKTNTEKANGKRRERKTESRTP